VGGARYKGAGWLARQATNTLAASGRLALQRYPPRLRKNAPGSLERLPQRYASVDFGQRGQMGQLHFLERIGNLWQVPVSRSTTNP
jgi:hypothetical protein